MGKKLGRFSYFDHPFNGQIGQVPRFWMPAYGLAYSDLQRKLAALYDRTPEIAETVVGRCSSFYPEEYLRDTPIASNVASYRAAGYTLAADLLCHRQEIDAQRVSVHTRSGVSFNPFQAIQPDGTVKFDEVYTEQMMAYCRKTLGARCVLENDSLRIPVGSIGPLYPRMYTFMKRMGLRGVVGERVGRLELRREVRGHRG